ncbi:MAG: hypothetical protein K1X94_09140 [Sandaracinaceae bacterium]|nr:hypothetical protein [Sandaracinaceae bacterium]
MRRSCTLVFLLASSGCGPSVETPDAHVADDADARQDTGPAGDGWAEVAPILERRCVPCHRDGEIGGFGLDTYERVAPLAPSIAGAVSSGRMPPFLPSEDDGCPSVDDFRNVPAADRARLVGWAEAGAPRGIGGPDRLVHTSEGPLGPADRRFAMELAYTPPPLTTRADDYRCFVIDPHVSAPFPTAAMSVEPGNRAIVHHAITFMVAPAQADEARRLDDAEEGPGYTCYGGAMVTPAYASGLWVPGDASVLEPPREDVGYWFPAGWQLILQVHYNVEHAHGEDRSEVVVWETPVPIGEVPRNLLVGDYDFVIPPRTARVEGTASGWFTAAGTSDVLGVSAAEGTIYAVTPHMHELGQSLRVQLVHADGTSQCVLSIPAWDFHWQGVFRLHEGVRAVAGDELRVTCAWSNPDGDETVTWGEGTSDEMCYASVALYSGR